MLSSLDEFVGYDLCIFSYVVFTKQHAMIREFLYFISMNDCKQYIKAIRSNKAVAATESNIKNGIYEQIAVTYRPLHAT